MFLVNYKCLSEQFIKKTIFMTRKKKIWTFDYLYHVLKYDVPNMYFISIKY